jgi:hypothetical protein
VILPPASGFADPLLSPGMASAVVAVGRLAEAVDPILRDGANPKQALTHFETAFQVEAEYIPRLLHCLFMGFHHYDIFRETFSIFRMGTLLSGLRSTRTRRALLPGAIMGFRLSGDPRPGGRDPQDSLRRAQKRQIQ